MLTATPASLLIDWEVAGHSLLSAKRRQDTQWILKTVWRHAINERLVVGESAVTSLVADFFAWRQSQGRAISRRQATQRVTRVLEVLNEQPGILAVLPTQPVRYHRATCLPQRGQVLVQAQALMATDRHLQPWARQCNSTDAWLLVLALRMVTHLGMGEAVVIGTLAALTRQQIQDGWVTIPCTPASQWPDDPHYRLRFPDPLRRPLRTLLTRGPTAPETWLFSLDAGQGLTPRSAREPSLRARLSAALRDYHHYLRRTANEHVANLPRSWAGITRSGRYVPVLRGVPPIWASLLHQYPLPSETPMPLLNTPVAHRYQPGESQGRLVSAVTAPAATLGDTTQPAGIASEADVAVAPEAARQAKNLLKQFMNAASRLTLQPTLTAKRLERPLQALVTHYDALLCEAMGDTDSYPRWILQWLYHQLHGEGNRISTAATYLSRLTKLPMMLHPGGLSLSEWDDAMVEDMVSETIGDMNWRHVTQHQFCRTLAQFIRFCQTQGALTEVTPLTGGQDMSVSGVRTRILTPAHMHTAWHTLTHQRPIGDPQLAMALPLALAFYGGLRASEILGLTLHNIVIDDDRGLRTCWIEILGGKTSAARRRVPLHVLAPPAVIDTLAQWTHYRRQSCPRQKLSHIALLGPHANPEAYTREALITPTLAWLRHLLGEDIDLHGLRHAALSWTLLRLHGAQHPEFVQSLYHRGYWELSEDSLAALLRHFCGAEGKDTLSRGTLWLHVIQWLGHRHIGTMLRHYAHTLGLIHSDVLARVHSKKEPSR